VSLYQRLAATGLEYERRRVSGSFVVCGDCSMASEGPKMGRKSVTVSARDRSSIDRRRFVDRSNRLHSPFSIVSPVILGPRVPVSSLISRRHCCFSER
jgi:hypothetical protein